MVEAQLLQNVFHLLRSVLILYISPLKPYHGYFRNIFCTSKNKCSKWEAKASVTAKRLSVVLKLYMIFCM